MAKASPAMGHSADKSGVPSTRVHALPITQVEAFTDEGHKLSALNAQVLQIRGRLHAHIRPELSL